MSSKNLLIILFLFVISACEWDLQRVDKKITDYDGNVYTSVTIGTQVWLKENLKTTHYRNGDPIPNVTDNNEWMSITNGAYRWNGNDIINKDDYGAFYNWYAVIDTRNLCPIGWHIPSDAEWTTLIDYLGGEDVAGGKMKETGTLHWIDPNTGATNESGFTALPGAAFKGYYDKWDSPGYYASWWSSEAKDDISAWNRFIANDKTGAYPSATPFKQGLSIRCIKD